MKKGVLYNGFFKEGLHVCGVMAHFIFAFIGLLYDNKGFLKFKGGI